MKANEVIKRLQQKLGAKEGHITRLELENEALINRLKQLEEKDSAE